MIDPSTRLLGVERRIDEGEYFMIHAPYQGGKTTCLIDLMKRLNAEGRYYALYLSVEALEVVTNVERGIEGIFGCITFALERSKIPFTYDERYREDKVCRPDVLLTIFLRDLAGSLDRPLVIFFDEVDCLSKGVRDSFLRQLQSGYDDRSVSPFVHSVALVSMRELYAESVTLKNFTKEEICLLYQQHTDETGQIFEDEAVELVWQQTQGQPWLVNAVACEVIVEILQSDYVSPITAKLVAEAIQRLVLRRGMHLSDLTGYLKDKRVRKIMEPIIMGEEVFDRSSDDFQCVMGWGLISTAGGKLAPANPIYTEAIARRLTYDIEQQFVEDRSGFLALRYMGDGRIDMDFLLRNFQRFWREYSDVWTTKFGYEEAVPYLILMAFLQRAVSGGGRIIREMAAGTGRLDICVVYESVKYPIELKLWRGEKSLEAGVEQTLRYMDVYGVCEGWLAIFDRSQTPWEEKIYLEKQVVGGRTVTVVGL
jgi:hypothetical protein